MSAILRVQGKTLQEHLRFHVIAGVQDVGIDMQPPPPRPTHTPTSPQCESLTKRHPGIGGEVFSLGVQCGSEGELDHKQAPF